MESKIELTQIYRYDNLVSDLNQLAKQFPNLVELEMIGTSVEGRKLLALKVGTGDVKVICHGAHHAREWMTSRLIVDFICHLMTSETKPWKHIRKEWLDRITFWFVPMVNPDGVTLVQDGPDHFSNRDELIDLNDDSLDFSSWKANARGVDLNRQYPIDWEEIQADPGRPSSSNYKGEHPLSEPEIKSLVDFVNQHDFDCALAYHSSGEEIFWRYNLPNRFIESFRPLANQLADVTKYCLIEPEGIPSGGGFTDWFLTKFKKPSFTFEIAPYIGPRPVPDHYYDQVFYDNKLVLYTVGDYLLDNSAERLKK